MKNKLIPYFCTLLLFLHSCVFIRIDDSIDLGDKFRYIQDYPQTIIYHENEKYKGVGINVVAPIVNAYNFDDRYIIARSSDMQKFDPEKYSSDSLVSYWIVDKEKPVGSIEPMDSINFYKQLEIQHISLRFK
jgi:hypothetical protein